MNGLKKRMLFAVLTSALVLSCLAACGGKGSDAGSAGELRVFNWGEYLDPDLIAAFEEETGIRVIYEEFETNEVMYAKLSQDPSAYDVLCPSDYMISKLIEQDMLSELDREKLPVAWENTGKEYWEMSEGFDPGNKYSVPYCWGTVGILYNKTMVTGPIDSWEVLWDEQYSGSILMQNSVRDAFMIPLMMKGYSMNTTSESEIAEAAQMLIDQKPLVQAYVVDQVRDKMIGDEAAIGVIYSGEALYTQRENENLEYVIPKEGTNVWIDSWVVTNGAKNMENAYAWIEFMSRAESALVNFEFITYSSPNDAARALIEDEAIRNSEIAYPHLENYKLDVYVNLGDEVDEMYNEYWMKVKSE